MRVLANPTLSWANGDGATGYDVYFDTVNPPVTKVSSNQASTTFASTAAYSTTYFWRINPINGSGTTTGDVLSFTTSTPTTVVTYGDFGVGTNWLMCLTATALSTQARTRRLLYGRYRLTRYHAMFVRQHRGDGFTILPR